MRIYGSFSGEHSLVRVSEGFAQVFPDAHRFDVTATMDNDLDDAVVPPGGSDKDGVFVGNLAQLEQLFRGKHERTWVMVAPNSNKIGALLEKRLQHFDRLLAPSRWAAGVLQSIFPEKQVMSVPHGVDPFFRPMEVPVEGYHVLHLSSTLLERKGTLSLLQAWKEADLPDATLYVSVPSGIVGYYSEWVHDLGLKNVKLTGRLDYSPSKLRALYCSMNLVVQPSRGEGFGLVPCEARSCGTPVLITCCTGHSEHAGEPGTMLIPTGDMEPIDDLPGALAPSLKVPDLAHALCRAYRARDLLSQEAKQNADAFRQKWSWENQLKGFCDVIAQ